jgi:Flp pilus assembly protein TadD
MAGVIPIQRRVQYALAYTVLNLLEEAADELETIPVAERATAEVVTAYVELHMAARHWEVVTRVARELTELAPAEERGWIAWAYALRELQRVEEARAVLLQVEPQLGKTSALLHYNLACYECLLGNRAEAKRRLATACRMEKAFKEDAQHDPDLAALRNEDPRDSDDKL